MKITIIVCQYGNFDPKLREPKEILGLKIYYRGLRKLLLEWMKSGAEIELIFAGGFTNRKASISEAESAKRYFFRHCLKRLNLEQIKFGVEEFSRKTSENIVYSYLGLAEKPESFIIVCDKKRAPKVWLLTRSLFGLRKKTVEVEIVAIERLDIHPHSKWWLQTLLGLKEVIFSKKFKELKSYLHTSMNW